MDGMSIGNVKAVQGNDLYAAFVYDYAYEISESSSTYMNCLLHARDQIIENYQTMLQNGEMTEEDLQKRFANEPDNMPDKRRYAYFCATVEDMFRKFDIDAPKWCKPCAENVLDLSEMIVTGTRPCVINDDSEYDNIPTRKTFLSHGIRVEANHTTFM